MDKEVKITYMYYHHSDEIYSINYRTYYNKLHRENGPAIIYYYKDGSIKEEQYFLDNKLHRIDGPAIKKYHFKNKSYLYQFWYFGSKINVSNEKDYIYYINSLLLK